MKQMKQSSDYFLNDKKVKATFCFYGEGKKYILLFLHYVRVWFNWHWKIALSSFTTRPSWRLSLGFAQLAFAMKSVTHTQTYIWTYKDCHNGYCLAYIASTSIPESNHYGYHCTYKHTYERTPTNIWIDRFLKSYLNSRQQCVIIYFKSSFSQIGIGEDGRIIQSKMLGMHWPSLDDTNSFRTCWN